MHKNHLTNTIQGYIVKLLQQSTPWGYIKNEQSVCPHCKHTQRDEDQKKLLQNRLRRIEGQVRGLQSMLEQDAYCNDILIQSAAVSAALSAFNRELLENHIRHCVARDIREGKDEVIDELMGTLKKLMK